MKILQSTALSAVLVASVAVAAWAQEQALAPSSGTPAPVVTNPGLPYSSARVPGPKIGPSNWIPGTSSSAAAAQTAPGAAPNTEGEYSSRGYGTGSYYSGKGFGPKPN